LKKLIAFCVLLMPLQAFSTVSPLHNISLSAGGYAPDDYSNKTSYNLKGVLHINDYMFTSIDFDYYDTYDNATKYFIGLGLIRPLTSTSAVYGSIAYGNRNQESEYSRQVKGGKFMAGYKMDVSNNWSLFVEAEFEKFDDTYRGEMNNDVVSDFSVGMYYNLSRDVYASFRLMDKGAMLGVAYDF